MLVLSLLAMTAPVAHVLELPNKLALDGGSWLFVQQHLYRGWGSVYGPVEIAAIFVSVSLCGMLRGERVALRAMALAAFSYVAIVVVFFIFNAPLNAAVNRWTSTTLPADWPRYRAQWETGHALAALLSILAFALVVRACAARLIATERD